MENKSETPQTTENVNPPSIGDTFSEEQKTYVMKILAQEREQVAAETRNAILDKERRRKEEGRKSIKPPEMFKGNKIDSEAFITKLDRYFNSRPTIYEEDEDKFDYAISCLEGDAFTWSIREIEDKKFATYEEFKSCFIEKYKDFDAQERAQNKIDSLRQGRSSVTKYLSKFEKYQKTSGYNELALLKAFKRGLNIEIRRGLLNSNCRTLATYTKAAETLSNEIIADKALERGFMISHQTQSNDTTPMELDQVSAKQIKKKIKGLQLQLKNVNLSKGASTKGPYAGRTHSICTKCGKWSLHNESECRSNKEKEKEKTVRNQEVQVSDTDEDSSDDEEETSEENF